MPHPTKLGDSVLIDPKTRERFADRESFGRWIDARLRQLEERHSEFCTGFSNATDRASHDRL